MNLSKRNVLKTFTILCLAASVLMGYQYLGAELYTQAEIWITDQEAGAMRWLSWLFHSPWTDMLVQYVFVLGVGHVLAWFVMCWLPKDDRKQTGLTGFDFVICSIASLGAGYMLNIVGTCINYGISMVTGKSFLEMNPVMDMMFDLSPSMLIYSCLLGPLMEEWMFRGIILKRARLFGDWTAVVFTAVLFGLMHGNISQFLYATAIGLILGYVAVKTNGIRYTVLIHILVNTYNTLTVAIEEWIYTIDPMILPVVYSMVLLGIMFLLIVGAVVVIIKYGPHWYRQMTERNGPWSENRKYVYKNPGFFIYLAICLIEFIGYLV